MKNWIAIIMSFLLLYGNMGLYAATHFCGGEAVATQISYQQVADGCGMPDEKDASSCDAEQLKKTSCCSNSFQSISTDELTSSAPVHISTPLLLAVALCLDLLLPAKAEEAPVWAYHEEGAPPLRDIYILHEKFLI